MSKSNLVIVSLILIIGALGCKSIKSFMPGKSASTVPIVDLDAPAAPRDVKIQLDKKQTATGKVTKTGGSVTLSTADGSKFTLDVPAGAVDADTDITMTAVKGVEGAPLDNNSPTAVQLEPSGLFFKEMATLTIVPAKEIPIKQQIIFGYEGDGKDYRLALIDHKSKEIKIKLMRFSGAGVGSGSDAAWAANLMIQARTAEDRIGHKISQYLQESRMRTFLEGEDSIDNEEFANRLKSYLDQLEDQVVRPEEAAAELDCKHAERAIQDLLSVERMRQLLGLPEATNTWERFGKLQKIWENCPAAYQIVGGLDDWQTNTKVCDIRKPFTLTGILSMRFSGGLSGTYEYSGGPFNANGKGTYTISLPDGVGKPGTMSGGGSGQITGDKVYTGSGVEKYTLTPIEPCQ